MLIVGPPLEPGSAEEFALRLTGPLDMLRTSVSIWMRQAMREEALKCAKDVCPYCGDAHRSWCTSAKWHDEMNDFYHFNAEKPGIVAAQCDARAIWRRLRAEDARRAPKPRDTGIGASIGIPAIPFIAPIPAIPGIAPAHIFPIQTGAAQGPSTVENYTLEHCDVCSGGGRNKRIANTPCNVCGGTGKVMKPL